jgi:hypothetical protein
MGAIMVELYKGPVIFKTSVSSSYLLQSKQQLLIFSSTPEHWVLGGILLAATSLSVSVWNVIQVQRFGHLFFFYLFLSSQTNFLNIDHLLSWEP